MNAEELVNIMAKHDMTAVDLSKSIGVSRQAVNNWVLERRSIPELVARMLRMFDHDPKTMDTFKSFASAKPTGHL